MVEIKMTVKGIDELNDTINRMAKNYSGAEEILLKRLAEILKEDTKQLTPVDTGKLRESWHATDVNNGTIAVYNNTEYACPVEFGHRIGTTGKVRAGRYMLTTAVNNLGDDINEMGKDFFDILLGD